MKNFNFILKMNDLTKGIAIIKRIQIILDTFLALL